MATKNISIRENVYKKLCESKGDNESFSDAILRILDKKPSLLAFSGILKEDDKELKFIEDEARGLRKSAKLRA